MRFLLRALLGLVTLLSLFLIAFKAHFGGELLRFPSPAPPLPLLISEADIEKRLEVVASLPVAPGNVAVSTTGRVFITFHPEGRPVGDKLVEIVAGQPVAFPNAQLQGDAGQPSLDTPLGVRIDSKGRLWVIDHGFHGLRQPRLWAFDIATRATVVRYDVPAAIAGVGSFLQDLAVDPEGRYVYIADASVIGGKPAIVVYDSQAGTAVRVLQGHDSVRDRPYLVRAKGKPMRLLGALFNVHVAIDSIALDRQGQWLYYGAMSHESLFRARTSDLCDRSLSADDLGRRVERFGPKVQTDGITTDSFGNVYLTDIEHGGITLLGADRQLRQLFTSPRVRWPDGLSFGPDGYLYIADSNLANLMMQSRGHMQAQAPYFVYRIRLNQGAPAGQ